MSESQSRYSIVERLTKQKLEIMGEKNTVELEIASFKHKIVEKTKEIEDFKKDWEAERATAHRGLERDLRALETKEKIAQEKMEKISEVMEEKIKAIDSALLRIEEISKSQSCNTT